MTSPSEPGPAPPPPRHLDRMRDRIRVKHYSLRTEKVYVDWARRYIVFHGRRHPRDLGAAQVEAFLSHLAVTRHVSASTQNQAKATLLFLYKEVLDVELPWLDEIVQAKVSRRLPVVLTTRETKALLDGLHGTQWLVASLLYGTGMRVLEGLRLRTKDIDFERRAIIVREGKGGQDRVTVLPENLITPLHDQLTVARRLHDQDPTEGFGDVEMPHALDLSTRAPGASGAGNPSFRRPRDRSIRAVASFVGITSTSRMSSVP